MTISVFKNLYKCLNKIKTQIKHGKPRKFIQSKNTKAFLQIRPPRMDKSNFGDFCYRGDAICHSLFQIEVRIGFWICWGIGGFVSQLWGYG